MIVQKRREGSQRKFKTVKGEVCHSIGLDMGLLLSIEGVWYTIQPETEEEWSHLDSEVDRAYGDWKIKQKNAKKLAKLTQK